MKHHTDPKIQRIAETWLRPAPVDATWLAGVADEIEIPAGSTLDTGRFTYVDLDATSPHRVVTGGGRPVVVDGPVTVLALARRDMAEAIRRLPELRDEAHRDEVRSDDVRGGAHRLAA